MENVIVFIRLPLGIKVAVEYEVFGKIVVNVYHVTTSDPIITIKLLDIAEIFEAWWDNALKDNFSADIALTQITTTSLDEANGPQSVLAVTPPISGGSVGDAVSNNVALVITLNTAKTGRSFKGRAYHAGLLRGQLTGNAVADATVAAIILDYIELDALLFAANSELVVASFVAGSVPREEGVATIVESFSGDTRVDTQRRRLPVQ